MCLFLLSGNETIVVKKVARYFVGCYWRLKLQTTFTHYHLHHRSIVVQCVSILYWSNCAYTKKTRQRDHKRQHGLSLIVHTAALNLFDLSKRIVWIIVAGIIFPSFSLSCTQYTVEIRCYATVQHAPIVNENGNSYEFIFISHSFNMYTVTVYT